MAVAKCKEMEMPESQSKSNSAAHEADSERDLARGCGVVRKDVKWLKSAPAKEESRTLEGVSSRPGEPEHRKSTRRRKHGNRKTVLPN